MVDDKSIQENNRKDLAYHLNEDYKKVTSEMTALKGSIKKLDDKMEALTTKVDDGAEVSKENTNILHSVQETQAQTNNKLNEVIDSLQGKVVLGQKELGALDKLHIVYDYYDGFLKPNKQTIESLIAGANSIKWIIGLCSALGISLGALVYVLLRYVIIP